MTGFDVCELLKRNATLARVLVIFVTSHDAPALEIDAFRMGAVDYVIKPLVVARLQVRVMQTTEQLRTAATAQHARACDSLRRDGRRASRCTGSDRRARLRERARQGSQQAPGAIVLDAQCCAADTSSQADAIEAALRTLLFAPDWPISRLS